MTDAEENRISISKIKKNPITTGNSKGKSPLQFFNPFGMQARVKPVCFENYFLFIIKRFYSTWQFLEFFNKILCFINYHPILK